MSGVISSFIGAVQKVFINGNQLSLYNEDTAKCAIVQEEDRLPCATNGVTKYNGPPCGIGKCILTHLVSYLSKCIIRELIEVNIMNSCNVLNRFCKD